MQPIIKYLACLNFILILLCVISNVYSQEIPISLIRVLKVENSSENYSIAFNSDGKILASAGKKPSITLWNVQTGKVLQELSPNVESSYDMYGRRQIYYRDFTNLAFHPNGHVLAATGCDGLIALWDLKNGQIIKTIMQRQWSCSYPTYSFLPIAFSPDGKMLATGLRDNTTRLWDIETGSILNNFKWQSQYTTDIYTIAFSPDGTILASGGHYQTIKLWDTHGGNELNTLKWQPTKTGWTGGHSPRAVKSIAFSPDGRLLVSGNEQEQTIILWSIQTGQVLRTFIWRAEHRGTVYADVYSVTFSPDGNTIAAGSDDGGSIKLFDVQTFRVLNTIISHPKTVRSVAFSPDGTILASAGDDATIKLWDVSLLDPGLAQLYFKNKHEMETELQTITQLLRPKDEFETQAEYVERSNEGYKAKKAIEEKYSQKFSQAKQEYGKTKQSRIEEQENEIQAKIAASISEATLKISTIGRYNADTEIFPITIGSITTNVKIPLVEAKSFKENWQQVKIKAMKRLKKDLVSYEYFDLIIIHPLTGSEYPLNLSIAEQSSSENLSRYVGSYSSVSETGDSCEELIIKLNDGNINVLYRGWYCGNGGPAPEFQLLRNVYIDAGTLRGTMDSGQEVAWRFKK